MRSTFPMLAVPFVSLVLVSSAGAQGVLMERNVSTMMAKTIAETALEQCQKDGYRVTVAVVDRAGQLRVLLRGDGTSPHTIEMARRKAFTARTFRQTTIDFAKRTETGPGAALRNVTDVIAAGGGVPIKVGEDVIGAIGVSGAPGGDKDEVCANTGIAKVADQLK